MNIYCSAYFKIQATNRFFVVLVPEEKFLRTIELEEQFGGKTYQAQKCKDEKVKAASKGKAAIGFVYEDSTEKTEEIVPGTYSKCLKYKYVLCLKSKHV